MLFNGYKHPKNTNKRVFRFSGRKNGGKKLNKGKTVFLPVKKNPPREKIFRPAERPGGSFCTLNHRGKGVYEVVDIH